MQEIHDVEIGLRIVRVPTVIPRVDRLKQVRHPRPAQLPRPSQVDGPGGLLLDRQAGRGRGGPVGGHADLQLFEPGVEAAAELGTPDEEHDHGQHRDNGKSHSGASS